MVGSFIGAECQLEIAGKSKNYLVRRKILLIRAEEGETGHLSNDTQARTLHTDHIHRISFARLGDMLGSRLWLQAMLWE